MSNAVLLYAPYAGAGTSDQYLVLFFGPDIHDAATAANVGVNSDLANNQITIDAAAVAAGYSAGDFTISGEDGSFSEGNGWLITCSGSVVGNAKLMPLAFDASGLTYSFLTPSATYTPAGVQSYVAAVSATEATVTYSFTGTPNGAYGVGSWQDTAGRTPSGIANWSFTGTPNSGLVSGTATINGSSTSDPGLLMSGVSVADGPLTLTDICDAIATTALAYWDVDPGNPGSNPPISGTYSVAPSTWQISSGVPFTNISSGTVTSVYGPGQAEPTFDTSGLFMSDGMGGQIAWDGDIAVTSFTDGADEVPYSGTETTTFTPGLDAVDAVPQIDTLTATASAGSLVITSILGSYSSAAIPWGPYANSAACCSAVAAAINAVLAANGVSDTVSVSAASWSPSSWSLNITLPYSVGAQSWNVDQSGLTSNLIMLAEVQTPGGSGGGGLRVNTGTGGGVQ